jgi:peptidoglycan/xylan/chitin deacetylase (PgdA/CDA1 family)
MLTALLYHRIGTNNALSISQFEKHMLFIKKRYPIVYPGQDPGVSITFDDATVDFYKNVFPLLKKHKVKVLLAVPTSYILDKTTISMEKRLCFSEVELFTPLSKDKGYFCTVEELLEMQNSSLVKIASHSCSHQNLLDPTVDLNHEIEVSKLFLQEKLKTTVDTFVYPYGKFNGSIRNLVAQYYSYQLRIGSGINFHAKDLFYRIPCDDRVDIAKVFTHSKILTFSFHTIVNKIRNR